MQETKMEGSLQLESTTVRLFKKKKAIFVLRVSSLKDKNVQILSLMFYYSFETT